MSKLTGSINAGAIATEDDTTRRAALRALVGAGALAIPAISASARALPDPIFVAIARRKAACEARIAMDDLIYSPGREVSQAEWDAWERAHDNEDAAFDDLCAGPPTTVAALRAIIAHLIFLDDGRLSSKMRQLLTNLQESRVLAS